MCEWGALSGQCWVSDVQPRPGLCTPLQEDTPTPGPASPVFPGGGLRSCPLLALTNRAPARGPPLCCVPSLLAPE